MAILAWHLLHDEADYRWAPARPTAAKIRAVELAAGASSRRGRVPGTGDARERAKLERQMERAVLAQAEAAYTAFVEARRERDAAAATGERLHEVKARARHGCAAEPDPQVSALRHGVDRVPLNDTPARRP